MATLPRKLLNEVRNSLTYFPIVAIIGPRQVGKTTLVKQLISNTGEECIYLDLERASDLNKLTDPELFFSQNREKMIIIDEIQFKEDLYPLLRSLVDETRKPGQFILLGSASPDLIRDSSETLAGRIAYHRLHPLTMDEIPLEMDQNKLWIRGGFPDALLAPTSDLTWQWMENFVNTYLNRDLLQLGLNAPGRTIRNLWSMLAHSSGQILNTSTFASSLGLSSPTINKYIDFLEGAFLIYSLQAFAPNMKKRLVKRPKLYLTDTGILHHLIGTENFNELAGHPGLGASWETFVLNQILAIKKRMIKIFFYRTHHGAEADFVLTKGEKVVAGIEVKYTNSPKLTKGNHNAFQDLNSPTNFVITPSSDDYLLQKNIRVCSLKTFLKNYLPEL
ncbi:ATP-binding protein [uncultured Draconibacterium sp.]|uniref:ATP-binding protein n=1 Tax=uncultured Draconibacterium sp. TaxID=1573823 RepID=UPI0029C7C4A9|nr:ATP-binding protein [uncultured Draconibacterium sp.]